MFTKQGIKTKFLISVKGWSNWYIKLR
jgi:hypothetical protein